MNMLLPASQNYASSVGAAVASSAVYVKHRLRLAAIKSPRCIKLLPGADEQSLHTMPSHARGAPLQHARTAASVAARRPRRRTSSKPLNVNVACRSPRAMRGAGQRPGGVPTGMPAWRARSEFRVRL